MGNITRNYVRNYLDFAYGWFSNPNSNLSDIHVWKFRIECTLEVVSLGQRVMIAKIKKSVLKYFNDI